MLQLIVVIPYMKRLILSFLLSYASRAGVLHAQTRTITGIVKSAEDSLPLAGSHRCCQRHTDRNRHQP